MTSSSVITNGGEDIIFQKIELDKEWISKEVNLVNDFECNETVDWIKEGNFKQVGLQFPNELLPVAVQIAQIIESQSGHKCAILGDTSFGSCCVDEVAGQHYNVDAIVHYGQACLTKSARLPIRYVFGNTPLCPPDFPNALLDGLVAVLPPPLTHNLLLLCDFRYLSSLRRLYPQLVDLYHTPDQKCSVLMSWPNLDSYKCNISPPTSGSPNLTKCGRVLDSIGSEYELSQCCVVYIGPQGLQLHNIMLSFSQCSAIYAIDPHGDILSPTLTRLRCEIQTTATNQLMKRRFFLVEKARDAQRVGILVGTLGAAGYLGCIDRLRSLLRAAGKVAYTIVVGKLNAAKLANFPELDVLVLVACPENSLLSSREFYRPVITPFEMEMACTQSGYAWAGQQFVTDFSQLLPGGSHYNLSKGDKEDTTLSEDNSAGNISLITGRVRPIMDPRQEGAVSESDRSTVAVRSDWSVAAVQRDQRTWRGLEPALGETEVSQGVVQGRKGIAIRYEDE